jgi:hypothetical protein
MIVAATVIGSTLAATETGVMSIMTAIGGATGPPIGPDVAALGGVTAAVLLAKDEAPGIARGRGPGQGRGLEGRLAGPETWVGDDRFLGTEEGQRERAGRGGGRRESGQQAGTRSVRVGRRGKGRQAGIRNAGTRGNRP